MNSNAFVIPDWVRHPIPENAVVDSALVERVAALCDAPLQLPEISRWLASIQSYATYEPVANVACEWVWKTFWAHEQQEQFELNPLLEFVLQHFPPRPKLRILRRLSKDADQRMRRKLFRIISQLRVNEVALPSGTDGVWDRSGWFHGLYRDKQLHKRGKPQERFELPSLSTVADIRELLGIVSEKQLGWMLLSSDIEGGPYTSFSIPKRNGAVRKICSPKSQLRRVQQKILHEILYRVPVHSAAHGFVPDRSTVTNATSHVGKPLVIKFDLENFFPTIGYRRVTGLFGSLGYEFGIGRFANQDASHRIAPTLARLCSYVVDPQKSSEGFLPQGAPTSPAITNLICRKLDARLSGLARENGATYTRYADDLTFSFAEDKIQVGRFRWWVDQICHQEGFHVHQAKFRVIRSSQRQMVTGIVVNESLNIPRKQRRKLRAIVHNCRVHGVESQAKGRVGFRGWLRGYASYVQMIHPDEGAALLAEVNELLGSGGDTGPPGSVNDE